MSNPGGTGASASEGHALARPGEADRVIATVSGRPITSTMLERRLDEIRRGPRARHVPPDGGPGSGVVRRWVVRELVTEAILAHEARTAGVAAGDVEGLVARVTGGVSIPEAESRAYYERNADLFSRPEARTVRQAIVGDEAGAAALAERVAAGDRAGLGEPDEVSRAQLSGPVGDAIFGAGVGTVVGPIRSELGWHVALIDAVRTARTIPFATARAGIEAELLAAARARAFDEWLERRRRALATIDPEFDHPGHPATGLPSHRH